MIFDSGKDFRDAFDFGYEAVWHWSKNRGTYWNARDFFWTHWEVKSAKPAQVRWHVEAPSATNDATLNRIKQEMIGDFLVPHFQNLIEQHGFAYFKGTRCQPQYIETSRCSEAFRIELPAGHNRGTAQANIEVVNSLMREPVIAVLSRYKTRLEECFAA